MMVTLATEFARRGVRVSLVLCSATGPYLSRVPPDVKVVDLKCPRVSRSLPRLVRYLRQERPDGLLSAMTHANLTALWARRLAGISTRLVVSEHNTLSRASRSAPVVRQRLMPLLARCFYPWADEIVAVSQGVADDLADVARLPRHRVTVVYNPLVSAAPIEHPVPSPDHAWFQADRRPVILATGRLTPQKDFATLIAAFAKVRQQHDVGLLILGEGPERARLLSAAEALGVRAHVRMPGFVENASAFMARAEVFVLSSAWEGFPAVLVEAMACGTPVVSTDCPSGPSEILDKGKYGPLVPVGDVDALASAIAKLLTTRPDTESLRRRASEFDVRTSVEAYLDLLLGTTGQAQRAMSSRAATST